MQQITSFIGVIAVWILLSVGSWWLHRVYVHRKQRRRLALSNEAWMRVREAPEIFADIRAAGLASGASDVQARTNALLSRINDYADYFDDVSALRADLSRTLKRDDCPPLTEILNMRRDMWATADVLLIDDPAVFGEAFSEPGAYEDFCREAEDLLFLDAAPLRDDPIALRLAMAEEDIQTFVSGVEGEITDERERERFPTWREIVAYPVSWARAVPRGLTWVGGAALTLGRGLARLAAHAGRAAVVAGAALWRVLREVLAVLGRTARGLSGILANRPRVRFPKGRAAAVGAGLRHAASRTPAYARRAARRVASLRDHSAVKKAAAAMRRARERVPEHVSQGLNRAGEMARDVRVRAKTAAFTARERARDFDASELGLHYDFLVKAHGLRKRYAETLRRAPDLGDSGRAFLARLELEKRSERLRLGTAKLRRRARLELVRFLSVLIAALERLRDRLADAPPQPAANTNLLTSQFSRLFLPPPSPREAGADFPGGLRAQARSWARGWGRPAQRMRNVTPEPEEEEETVAAEPPPEAETAHSPESEPAASDAGRTERSASSEDPESDPTTDAVRRVRRLFGIRDRARGPKSDRKYSGGAGRANGKAEGADRAERAHFGNERHDAAADGERAEKSRRSESAKAQILPPLRGSRAGVYDASSGNARKRDSLRSRLSTMGDDQANEAEPEDQDAHKASAERKEKAAGGRWRRWFGL